MITDQDITKLKKVFLTKEDAKKFVTKEDAKKFATKDDLKRFATKDDLKNFATKDDLNRFATKGDLQEVKEEVSAVKETQQGIMTGIDKIIGKLDDMKHEYAALKISDDRQNRQIHHLADKVQTTLPK